MKGDKKVGRITQFGINEDVTNNIRIAVYMRLSKANANKKILDESNSISMQRILIRNYIASYFEVCQIVEYQEI